MEINKGSDCLLPVWEVRHGSVMALREILTHQGASAGVCVPDFNFYGSLCFQNKDIDKASTVQRERVIDLNTEILMDESEPKPKKPKIEDIASSYIDTVVPPCKSSSFDISIKVEDNNLIFPVGQVNGELGIRCEEVKPEAALDHAYYSCEDVVTMAKSKSCSEDNGKADILNNLPENSQLMDLVKLTRHSWFKNCEFLQDCAVRFLCVLSLDRYNFLINFDSLY